MIPASRLAVACLEETVAHFIAALLTYTKTVTDAFLKRLERDYDDICEFFEKHCIKEKVLRPLPALRATRHTISSC
jgi:exocyst complex component 3